MKYNFDISFLKITVLNRLALIILCLFSSSLLGKEFRLISLDHFEQFDEMLFFNEKGPQHINLRKYYLNTSKPIPKSNILYLFSIDSETKEASKTPVLSIPFKNKDSDFIILLKKGTSVDEFTYRFIPNDADSLPDLSASVFNTTEKPVLIKMGETIIKIAPLSQKIIPLPANKEGFFDEKVVFAAQKQDKSIDYFHSSFWRVYSGNKKLCFIELDEEKEKYKLIRIPLRHQ